LGILCLVIPTVEFASSLVISDLNVFLLVEQNELFVDIVMALATIIRA
jgi:hypothetical protein